MGAVQGDPDAIVIGSGPNGLVAGSVLAQAGLSVLVLEANEVRAGGAVGSEAATRPGFVHDVGAAFFPWAKLSTAFRSLPLEEHGLRWRRATFDSCHPAPDGSYASIAGDHDATAAHFGSTEDGDRWRRVASWYASIEPQVVGMLLDAFPAVGPTARLGPVHLSRLAAVFLSSGRHLSERWFTSPAARRVLPGLALHADVGPDDRFGAALGFMLGMAAATSGYVVPEGGARSITEALLGCLRGYSGVLRLGGRVARVVVSGGRARAVRLTSGEEIATRVVLADTDVAALLLDLVEREYVPRRVVRFMEHYPRGWGTFKVDWALDGPVPWSVATARESAVVHAGDSIDDLSRFTAQVRRGEVPDNPYLVIGQQSLLDPTRAPPGCHTLWAYSRVPPAVRGGWAPRPKGSATASMPASKRSPQASAPGSWTGGSSLQTSYMPWTPTWSAETSAEVRTRGTGNSSFGRSSHIFATACPSKAFTCAPATPIRVPECTGCVATTPRNGCSKTSVRRSFPSQAWRKTC